MTYDNNGNLLTVTNNCGTTTYTWDVRNRLTGINGYKSDCSTLTASFQYDAIGKRTAKTINGTTTQYVYDSLDVIQEKQGGSVSANYIKTLNIDEPLTRIKGSTVRHYVTDALGSVIALTDDSGVVKTTYTYDPFGNVTISGETSDNPFQYTGRENDGTGLYYYRARYYSPELQRFISEDPLSLTRLFIWKQINPTFSLAKRLYRFTLRNPKVLNKYPYVGNDPTNFTDPSGLLTQADIKQYSKCVAKCVKATSDYNEFQRRNARCKEIYTNCLVYCGSMPEPRLRSLCITICKTINTGCKGWAGYILIDDLATCMKECKDEKCEERQKNSR
jgi:RHS repeat-associated protein